LAIGIAKPVGETRVSSVDEAQ